ncbi:MAG: carboxylating nicotinate-nucleotide diphosphorylase [Planctomycetota bacterium]
MTSPTGSPRPAARLQLDDLLRAALAEDLGDKGDITTLLSLGGRGPVGTGRILAKAPGRLSGGPIAQRVFQLVDPAVEVQLKLADGAAVRPGDVVLALRGRAASLLEAERTALNVLAHLSGVATLTARFVEAVAGTRAHIVDTRKTTPGLRLLEKAAVVHGGGRNHRMGLYDEVLLKENHFAMAGGQHRDVVARVKAGAPQGTRIIAEATTLAEAWAVAEGGADVLLLDNFTTAQLAEAITQLARHPRRAEFLTEASGGVSLATVPEIARTGVDRISVGALTHSAPVLDLSLILDPLPAAAAAAPLPSRPERRA